MGPYGVNSTCLWLVCCVNRPLEMESSTCRSSEGSIRTPTHLTQGNPFQYSEAKEQVLSISHVDLELFRKRAISGSSVTIAQLKTILIVLYDALRYIIKPIS